MKQNPKAMGVFVIVLLLSLIIITIILILKDGYYKKMGPFYLILFLVLKLSFIGILIYSYFKCRNNPEACKNHNLYSVNKNINKGDNIDVINDIKIKKLYNEDLAVYNLFTYGGWKNFQIWIASVSQNAWKDLLFTIIIFLIPFPVLPSSPIERFYIMLSKLGLYKLSLIIILGNPIYIINDGSQYNNSNKEEKVEIISSISFIVIFAVLIGYELIIKKHIKN
jgi:hypothetical protein